MLGEIGKKRITVESRRQMMSNVDAIIEWLRIRFEKLELGANDHGDVNLTSFDSEKGIGIETVSIIVGREDGQGKMKDVLLSDEFAHPSIDIYGEMFGRPAHVGEVTFPTYRGQAQEVTALSSGLQMGGNEIGPLHDLTPGDAPLLVTGPQALSAYAYIKGAGEDNVDRPIPKGVAARRYLKIDS